MSAFVDGMAIASGAVVVVTGVAAILAGAQRKWRSTVGSRRALRSAINSMAAGMPVEKLDALFGPCSLRMLAEVQRRPPPEDPTSAATPPGHTSSQVSDQLRQLIYVTKHAVVDTYLENALDVVIAFSVTTTDKRFKPDIGNLSFGLFNGVRLGKSSFMRVANSSGLINGFKWWNGARNNGYAESYYGANPGGYQTYIVAHNQAGAGVLALELVPEDAAPHVAWGIYPAEFTSVRYAEQPSDFEGWFPFRDATTVNTFQVLSPAWQWDPPWPGVHEDITRVLRNPPLTVRMRIQRILLDRKVSREVNATIRRRT